jgi:multidrug resistance efflux pump
MNKVFNLRRVGWVVGGAALVAVLVGARLLNSPSRADYPADKTRPTGKGVVCFGQVDLEHGVTDLNPSVAGRVTVVEVRENQEVKAGTVLLRVDDYLARRRVREARADLEAARQRLAEALKLPRRQQVRLEQQRAAIEAVRQRLAATRKLLAQSRRLKKKGLAGEADLEASRAMVRQVEALERVEQARLRELELTDTTTAINTARAEVSARQARLDQARRAAEDCALKAPADGTVLRVLVNPGALLGPQSPRPAIKFCPKGQWVIRAEVEQEFANRVKPHQLADIQDDAAGGPTWRGRVKSVGSWFSKRRLAMLEPSRFNDVDTLECLITLDRGQPPLRIGQRVRVRLRP